LAAFTRAVITEAHLASTLLVENGGEKLVHGSGGMELLRAA
jgi:hypothetical protein